MNVHKETIEAMHNVTGAMFQMNRWWDSALSVLKINFVCDNAASLIHPYIAHAYPIIADEVTGILEMFNILAIYPATTEGDTNYVSLVDMMNRMMDRTIELQNIVMGAIDVSIKHKDYLIKVELDKILTKVNQQVEQIILIRDKAELYGNDYTSFDYHIPSFFFLNK